MQTNIKQSMLLVPFSQLCIGHTFCILHRDNTIDNNDHVYIKTKEAKVAEENVFINAVDINNGDLSYINPELKVAMVEPIDEIEFKMASPS